MQFHRRVGDHELDRLAIGERPAESHADFRVFDHHIEGALGDAHGTRAVASDASFADPLLRDGKTAADLPMTFAAGHADVFEDESARRLAHHRWPLPFEETPGLLRSTAKQVMPPRAFFSGSVRAINWTNRRGPRR